MRASTRNTVTGLICFCLALRICDASTVLGTFRIVGATAHQATRATATVNRYHGESAAAAGYCSIACLGCAAGAMPWSRFHAAGAPLQSGLADRFSHIHPAHSAATRHTAVGMLILRSLGHHYLCRQHQARNRCRILQREPRHLGRVQYALFKQVAVLTGCRVVAV